jgi:hypothetical protein
MQHYVGLDVSVKATSVCIVDQAGIAKEQLIRRMSFEKPL